MTYLLFLDDERYPPHDGRIWIIARTVEEAVLKVEASGLPLFISWDHDLGPGKTGMDFARWLGDYCLDKGLAPDFDYYVHSQNPIGRDNINGYLAGLKEALPCTTRP